MRNAKCEMREDLKTGSQDKTLLPAATDFYLSQNYARRRTLSN